MTGPRPLRKIAIINQKGGVGKTTTAVNLAGAFAEQGYKTLLLDCDSQGDLSTVFLPGHEELPTSIADIFAGTPVSIRELMHELPHENLFLVPADRRLNQFDKTFGYEDDPRSLALADALQGIEHEFEIILFDCAPRAHLSSFAALVAATDVLVPVQPSQFAIASLLTLHQEIENVRLSRNPRLSVRGYFLSMLKPRSPTQKTCREALIQALGANLVFKTAIRRWRPVRRFRPTVRSLQLAVQTQP
jgi:chromosome partitioning protein